MKKIILSLLLFALVCSGCSEKPVTNTEVLKFANEFSKSLGKQGVTDSLFLWTFGVTNNADLRKLEASRIAPVVFLNLTQIKNLSFSKFDTLLDSTKTDKRVVEYSLGDRTVSEWVFRKIDRESTPSMSLKSFVLSRKRTSPVFGEACDSVLYPFDPKKVTLVIAGVPFVISYGMDYLKLLIHDGEVFHSFHVVSYQKVRYVVPLNDSDGSYIQNRTGMTLKNFYSILMKGGMISGGIIDDMVRSQVPISVNQSTH